jgi:hypothetical protein
MTRTTALLLAGAALVPLACDAGDEAMPSLTTDSVTRMPFFVHTVEGRPPSDPGTPIYDVGTCRPVLAPDGHHVTLGEFDRASGSLSVACLPGGGTRIAVRMHGLIPRGVYSVWQVTFRDPGFEPTFANMVGSGAVGPADGTGSVMVASPTGEATLSAVTPPGRLSKMGTMGDCLMTPPLDWLVLAAYHGGARDRAELAASTPVVQTGWLRPSGDDQGPKQ